MELGGRGDEVGSEQMEKGLIGTAKKFGPHLQALEVCVGGVGECQLLRKTWPFSCFTLELGEEGKKSRYI